MRLVEVHGLTQEHHQKADDSGRMNFDEGEVGAIRLGHKASPAWFAWRLRALSQRSKIILEQPWRQGGRVDVHHSGRARKEDA